MYRGSLHLLSSKIFLLNQLQPGVVFLYPGDIEKQHQTATLNESIPDKKKINLYFYFHTSLTLLCGASKAFIKAFKDFIKPFEAPQRIAKIKILFKLI